jgi:hypothetical protein
MPARPRRRGSSAPKATSAASHSPDPRHSRSSWACCEAVRPRIAPSRTRQLERADNCTSFAEPRPAFSLVGTALSVGRLILDWSWVRDPPGPQAGLTSRFVRCNRGERGSTALPPAEQPSVPPSYASKQLTAHLVPEALRHRGRVADERSADAIARTDLPLARDTPSRRSNPSRHQLTRRQWRYSGAGPPHLCCMIPSPTPVPTKPCDSNPTEPSSGPDG